MRWYVYGDLEGTGGTPGGEIFRSSLQETSPTTTGLNGMTL